MQGLSVLLAVKLTDLERRAIGHRLTGRPIAVTNKSATQFLYDEIHRILTDVSIEYRESLISEHGTIAVPMVSRGDSGVWHLAKTEPERTTNGWSCAIECDSRVDVFDNALVPTKREELGEGGRVCRKCVK